MGLVLALASIAFLPVAETVVPKLPSVLVDVAPANDKGAWILARDERYGDLELWRLTGSGRGERVALPDPDGRRLQAIAASPEGADVWVLSHRAVLHLSTPLPVTPVDPHAPPPAPTPAPEWRATPLWLEGGDLKRATIVPLGANRVAWVAELAGADGGPRVVGEILESGASVATFSMPCSFRSGASADGAGGLVLSGIGRITPSPNGWLGSYAACGDPSGNAIDWQRAPLSLPGKIVAANGPEFWHWQGDVLKKGDADAFTIPKRSDGAPVRALGSTPAPEGRLWLGVHGYVGRKTITVMSLGTGGVESSMALPLPRWWKPFLRTETLTLRDGAGTLWVLQSYPGKASMLLRRDGTWGKWRAFYGANVKPRVELLKKPEAGQTPGQIQQTYESSYSCLAPVRSCFAPGQ